MSAADIDFYVTAFVTLVVVIDPIGTTPIFVALTQGMASARRRAIAVRACLVGLFVLTLFGLLGDAVLAFVGISMPAFRIAGGMLLFLTAIEMLFGRRTQRRRDQLRTTTTSTTTRRSFRWASRFSPDPGGSPR